MKGLLAGAGLAVSGTFTCLIVIVLLLPGVGTPTRTGGLSGALRPGSVPAGLTALIQQAASTCQAVTPALLAAQLQTESGWDPNARSVAGAQGLAQFLPGTWRLWGVDANGDGIASPLDPADAIATQARYDCALAGQMSQALRRGQVRGDLTELMLAAYNAGPAAVLAAGGVPAIEETRAYIARITATAATYTDATGAGLAATADLGARIVAAAQSQTGVPYAWGGGTVTGPSAGIGRGSGTVGFDCSGLVLFAAYQASGGRLRLPHSADAQTRTGTPVPVTQLRPGDVISFTRPGQDQAHHVGIYTGSGRMIHAPQTGRTVTITALDPWQGQQWRAVRYT